MRSKGERAGRFWITILIGALVVVGLISWRIGVLGGSENKSLIDHFENGDQSRGEGYSESWMARSGSVEQNLGDSTLIPVASRGEPIGELVLEGQVLDPEGLPASGAHVSLRLLLTPGVRIATAGPDGTFSFDRMVPRSVRLGARRGAQVGGPVSHQLTDKSDPVVIRLRQGVEVHVVVREAVDGKPIPGAKVWIEDSGKRESSTGPDGVARFEGVSVLGSFVVVEAQGFAPWRDYRSIPPGARAPVILQVELVGGAPLFGIVLSAEGAPVSGAQVVAVDTTAFSGVDAPRDDGVVSDTQGRFKFPILAAGTYRLLGSHPDHAPGQVGPIKLDGARPLAGVQVTLGAAGVARGRVIEPDGRPAAHASVVAVPPAKSPKRMAGRGGGASYLLGVADREGFFELRGLPRERIALAAMTVEAVSEEVEVDLGPQPVVEGVMLSLTVGGCIAGKVVGAKGQGIPEVSVTAMASFEDGTDEKAFARGRTRQVMTDGGGGFEFKGLVEGTYSLRASQYAGRMDFNRPEAVEAQTGDLDVRIVLLEDGALKGQLSYADGTHPPRFEVVLGFGAALPFEPADGVFEIRNLGSGEIEVTIQGPAFAPRSMGTVKIEEGKVTDLGEVKVERGRRISGRVVDADRRPVESAKVVFGTWLTGDGNRSIIPNQMGDVGNLRQAWSGRAGGFELLGIGQEEGAVTADHERLGRSVPVTVAAGAEDASVELVLQATGSIEGFIRLNGQPLGGSYLEVYAPEVSNHRYSLTSGPDGAYLFAKVPAGKLVVTAALPGNRKADVTRKEVEVGPGERIYVDIDIIQGELDLEVQVRPVVGGRLEEAWVFLNKGRVQASTVREMRAAFQALGGRVQVSMCRPARSCMFSGLESGEHTICGVPLIGDSNDTTLIKRIHAHFEERRVYCIVFPIALSPPLQLAFLTLPEMEPVP